jgi:hypothetical protein
MAHQIAEHRGGGAATRIHDDDVTGPGDVERLVDDQIVGRPAANRHRETA